MVWADWTAKHLCPQGEACEECGGTLEGVYGTTDGVDTVFIHDWTTPKPEDQRDG